MSNGGTLTRLTIRGFKSIRALDLTLTNLNVLIGPNGAGKSNLIGFFRFMNKLADGGLQLFVAQQGGTEKILYFGEKTTDRLEIALDCSPNRYACTLVPTRTGGLIFAKESCAFRGEHGSRQVSLAKAGAEETGLPPWREGQEGARAVEEFTAEFLHYWQVYHFHDTSESARVKKPGMLWDCRRLQPDAGNLAAFLRILRVVHAQAYADIVATVRRVAPFFHDFVLEPQADNQQFIALVWKHVGRDDYFDAADLSDGTLRFICLATLLLQPDPPPTIVLDEPELGLHPYALQLLGGMIRSAATRTQIVLATQSVTLANQFGWQDLIVADRQDNASVFRRLAEDEVRDWLDQYAMGDLWQKNLIGGTPR
jgi:predicted ATPase